MVMCIELAHINHVAGSSAAGVSCVWACSRHVSSIFSYLSLFIFQGQLERYVKREHARMDGLKKSVKASVRGNSMGNVGARGAVGGARVPLRTTKIRFRASPDGNKKKEEKSKVVSIKPAASSGPTGGKLPSQKKMAGKSNDQNGNKKKESPSMKATSKSTGVASRGAGVKAISPKTKTVKANGQSGSKQKTSVSAKAASVKTSGTSSTGQQTKLPSQKAAVEKTNGQKDDHKKTVASMKVAGKCTGVVSGVQRGGKLTSPKTKKTIAPSTDKKK